MIKVSVIVPVYNAATFLKECMDSLCRQTLNEMEIICVNDGSTDSSLDLLQAYVRKDSRVRIISQANHGYGYAVNTGMDAAAGKYIGLVEPDDLVLADMYQRLYEIAEYMDLDFVKSDFYRFRQVGKKRKVERVCLSKTDRYYNQVIDPDENSEVFRFVMNTWTGIYRLEFLRRCQIQHNETPGASFQDLGFWFQTFCLARRIYFMDQPFYMYRTDNPGSSVHCVKRLSVLSGEYEFMRSFLRKHNELGKKYRYIYSWKKYHDYQAMLGRVKKEERRQFLQQFCLEFLEAEKEGWISSGCFRFNEWMLLRMIMGKPEKYLAIFGLQDIRYRIGYYVQYYGLIRTLRKVAEMAAGSR